MTVGKDVSMLFPDVVNCMQTDDLELKKLVYLYLINYAKTQPDLAIMAVNTFVKVCRGMKGYVWVWCVWGYGGGVWWDIGRLRPARRPSLLEPQKKDLNADQPGQPPAWVFWHPQLLLAEQVADIEAELAETVAHFQNLPPAELEKRFRKPGGAVGHHFIVEDSAAANLPGGARMALELIKRRLEETLRAQTPYKAVGVALVFSRHNPRPDGPMHQDKYTGRHAYQMPDPAPDSHPDVRGGLRWLISFGADRSMAYSRMVDGVLVPEPLPDGCATAQVIGQSARAAGAPRSEDGPRGDLWHGRINSGGGLEVTVRVDMRLPALHRQCLPVPVFKGNFAYKLFHQGRAFQGVGGGRPSAPPVSMAERCVKRHCGRCMRQTAATNKAANEGAWYWVCPPGSCPQQDSTEAWKGPTAAVGGSGCKCCCPPKQAVNRGKRKGKAKLFSSPKAAKNRKGKAAAAARE
jgi:hypothetical protein